MHIRSRRDRRAAQDGRRRRKKSDPTSARPAHHSHEIPEIAPKWHDECLVESEIVRGNLAVVVAPGREPSIQIEFQFPKDAKGKVRRGYELRIRSRGGVPFPACYIYRVTQIREDEDCFAARLVRRSWTDTET